MSPAAMALAAITVMLWILWSDTLRQRRPPAVLYAVRVALYLIVTGILILNLSRGVFRGGSVAIAVLAVLVGLVGAGYFGKRLVRRA